MFKLFGKKKTEESQAPKAPQNPEFAKLAAQFGFEELDILAVTGDNAFVADQLEESGLWQITIALTAWMEEDSPDIHREDSALVMLGDDQLRGYVQQRVPSDFILKTRARLSLDGKRLLMLELPQPGFDPDLKAILEEQKKPVERQAEGLGTFTLSRTANWFQTEVDWLGQSVQLTYDNGSDADMAAAEAHARALMAAQADLDVRLRAFAADKLLELAIDWAQDSGCEEYEPVEITRDEFMERLAPEAIQIGPDGSFDFWFNDGQLFWGHAIHVTGDLTNGPANAEMEG